MLYVRALFRYALETNAEDTVFTEMKNLSDCFSKNPNLRATLDNPVLNTRGKLELIKTAAGGKVSDYFVRFVELVLRQRRENHLQTISLLFLDEYRKYKNITIGKLVTASPMDKDTINKIKTLVGQTKNGTVDFETEVKPEIAGGFILYIDSFRLDASVSTQLKRIKDGLLNKNKRTA